MNAKFIRNELITSDQKTCGDFFCELFGWEREEVDMGPMGIYTLFKEDGNDVAGMMNPLTNYSRSRPPFWSAYIEVDDVDAYAAKVEELGGTIIAPPEDVPNVGRVCMFADPKGAPVCLMAPATPPTK
jgi:predicted enzyme related to lactoylglutathione lyase